MIESWWQAHELDFIVEGVIAAFLLVVGGCYLVADIRRERKQKRKDGLL